MVDQNYFFTQRRWDEHMKGLKKENGSDNETLERIAEHPLYQCTGQGDPSWDGDEYLPQGTVGAVVLDRFGTVCAATSTGGLTNKLPGRIGDTPTLGAGFWAEEWTTNSADITLTPPGLSSTPLDMLSRGDLISLLVSCLPTLSGSSNTSKSPAHAQGKTVRHAVGMSGTGNGDSFLRMDAVRTAAAMCRFSPSVSLAQAIHAMVGPGGELEKSAGDRFGKTGEGEGGIIGIELTASGSQVIQSFNCGGMFRAWVDDAGKHHFMAFREKY
jgi:L-asparaginase